MDLFKWVGRKKREEEWMRQPRRLPSFAKDLPEDSGRWFVTQEFVNDEDKNLRVYLAIYQPDPNVDKWRIYHVDYNLKHEDRVNAACTSETTDPMAIVKELRDYEKRLKNSAAYIPHPDQRNTYLPFANKYGIHYDYDGNVFRVQTETPLAKGTFMNRESLDKIFHKEAAKEIPLDTWEGIYKGIVESRSPDWTVTEELFGAIPAGEATLIVPAIVQYDASAWEAPKAAKPVVADPPRQLPAENDKITPATAESAATTPPAAETPATAPAEVPVTVNGKTFEHLAQEKPYAHFTALQKLKRTRPLTLEDLAKDLGYAEYGSIMKQMMVRLNELPRTMTGNTASRYEKESLLKWFARFTFDAPLAGDRMRLAEHECNATILVGLVRAGQALYAEQFGPGKKFTPEGLQLVSTIGATASRFAVERLGLEEEEAKKIADVISKGPDPLGPQLPLEKTFERLPPPAVKPAPPKPPAAAAPKKKTSYTNRGGY